MQEVLVSKIFNYTSTPTKNVEGQFWFNPSTNVLSRFNGTAWKPITVSSDDVAVLTDGNKVSLTSYLNTQIAALAEGIDSKQDKLITYKETQVATRAADIVGASASINADTLELKGGSLVINNNKISGDAIATSISTTASDNKLATEKAVKTELDKKQDNLSLYSEGEVGNAAGWVNIGKDTSKISTGAGDVTLTATQNITLDAGSTIEIKNATSISGSVIATSISSEDTAISGQIPTVGAVATSLNTKQNKLASYSETTLPPEAGTAGGKTTVDINALTLQITTDTNLGGNTTFKGGNVSVENGLFTNELHVSESITGNAVLSSISSKPVDTKILSEKAVNDALATKQNSLKYYTEDTTKTVSKLSSNRLEVACYDSDGNTVNPFISDNDTGIAIGGEENYGYKTAFTNIGKGYINLETPAGDSSLNADGLKIEGSNTGVFKITPRPVATDFTTNKIASISNDLYSHGLLSLDNDKVNISGATVSSIAPSAFTSTEAQTLICADAFAVKPTTKTLFGFNNGAYNILTNRSAGLFYLKDTDAKSTGIAINPDRILLSDYNSYNGTSDDDSYFETTTISKGVINLQKRANGSSQFIDTGSIKPDTIKLSNGKRDSEYDYTSNIVITGSRTSGFATNFHGVAYSGTQHDSNGDTQWFIGRTVDGDNIVDGYPTFSKPYIKGFANAEFSEKVQATTIQAGKEVSAYSGVATLTQSGLDFNTPAGTATYSYKDISLLTANFEVKAKSGDTPAYVQIPDGNTQNGFKIWKGTETEFKALTSVNSDTVYLRVQDNNRIKATVGADTTNLENITDSYTLSSMAFTSFITDTKYNNAQGSILITPNLTNSGALIFGEGVTDTSKGFPLYPDNIVSIPFKNITNFKVAGNLNDSFNYIISFDI